jgi:tetratricopeptide (TPR) repeat protein
MEEQDIALIDQYLNGELAENEDIAFRQRLADDKDFAQLFEDVRYLQKGLERAELEKAWKVIQETEVSIDDTAPTRATTFRWKVWVPVAASATLIAVAVWFLLLTNTTPQKLYAAYFEVYPNVEAPIYRDSSAQADSLTAKDMAFRRYADEDYDMAIELFESIQKPDEGTLFYLGMSYLAKGEAAKAAAIWEPLSKEAEDYKTQVQWYLALAWLKLDEDEKAKKLFEILAESGTAYEERSRAILKAL